MMSFSRRNLLLLSEIVKVGEKAKGIRHTLCVLIFIHLLTLHWEDFSQLKINNSRIEDIIGAFDPDCDLPLFSIYF